MRYEVPGGTFVAPFCVWNHDITGWPGEIVSSTPEVKTHAKNSELVYLIIFILSTTSSQAGETYLMQRDRGKITYSATRQGPDTSLEYLNLNLKM